MKSLDVTFPDPVANLACDEALLDRAEDTGEALLRFWEPTAPFVVLGYANEAAVEANLPACEELGIPVLRRCSGGGTVVQLPGCLNYSLILPFSHAAALESVTGTNRFVMERHRDAVAGLVQGKVTWDGSTDLALDGRKFSGNAQRRKRRTLLFHGSFLLQADLELISRVLPPPSKQPDYRASRSHGDFLVNLRIPPEALRQRLAGVWNADAPGEAPSAAALEELIGQKYGRADWNLRS
jgi:lipoate---protein ligase